MNSNRFLNHLRTRLLGPPVPRKTEPARWWWATGALQAHADRSVAIGLRRNEADDIGTGMVEVTTCSVARRDAQ
jgi:hypothetical protein